MTCSYQPCQFPPQGRYFQCDNRTFCQFHLPMHDQNGYAHGKHTWGKRENDNFFEAIRDLFQQQAHMSDQSVDLSGVIFSGQNNFGSIASLTDDKKKVCVKFTGAIFYEPVDLKGLFFHNVFFEKTVFRKKLSLENTNFREKTNFQNTVFNESVQFEKCFFSGKVSFKDAQFKDDINFIESTFADNVYFTNFSNRPNFSKSVIFRRTKFLKRASFFGTICEGNCEFSAANISRMLYFKKVRIRSMLRFVSINTNVDKVDPQKFGAIVIQNAKIGDISFKNSHVKKLYIRDQSEIGKLHFTKPEKLLELNRIKIEISNSTIEGDSDFSHFEFQDICSFKKTVFKGKANFSDAKFTKNTKFENVTFTSIVLFENAEFFEKVNFSEAKVEKMLAEKCTFMRSTDFSKGTFYKSPRFHGAKFHSDTNFTNAKFIDFDSESAESDYRALRHMWKKFATVFSRQNSTATKGKPTAS